MNDRAGHAESPLWAPAEQALYWVDTRPGTIYRLERGSGRRSAWETPSRLGAVGLRRGGLIVATKNGILTLDTATGRFAEVADPEAGEPDSRINDAKVDPAGRFWFGSTHDESQTPTGRLYRLAPDRTVAQVDAGFTIPNGFAWSLDRGTMFVSDSPRGEIYAYDFDPGSGAVRGRRTFAHVPANAGTPDGSTVDAKGYLWSARFGGGTIARYALDGTIAETIALPTARPTNVAFGGEDLRTLFVSTASRGLTDAELAAQPLAGAILALRVDVPGLPEPLFAG